MRNTNSGKIMHFFLYEASTGTTEKEYKIGESFRLRDLKSALQGLIQNDQNEIGT
jgi:hypothetical protein